MQANVVVLFVFAVTSLVLMIPNDKLSGFVMVRQPQEKENLYHPLYHGRRRRPIYFVRSGAKLVQLCC